MVSVKDVDCDTNAVPEVALAAQTALKTQPVPSAQLSRAVRRQLADRGLWLQKYLVSEDLTTVFDSTWLKSVPKSGREAAHVFQAALGPVEPQRQTLCIPVEVPLRRLLTTVRFTPSTTEPIHEGRALAFELSFSSSLAWLGVENTGAEGTPTYRVTYDVQASGDDWIVVGKKRGVYTADTSKPETERVVLVPVRHGTLALPPVAVQLLEPSANGVGGPRSHDRVHCETYVANAAYGVHVLPAKTGMTALVPIATEWEE